MSTRRLTEIKCDECGAARRFNDESVHAVLMLLAKTGWTWRAVPTGKGLSTRFDLCPRCSRAAAKVDQPQPEPAI